MRRDLKVILVGDKIEHLIGELTTQICGNQHLQDKEVLWMLRISQRG
jgi:hypothetical protein